MTFAVKYNLRAKTLRDAGLTYKTIATRLNISISSAYRAANPAAANAVKGRTRSKINTEQNAIALRAKGMTYTAIAHKLGLPTGTAWRMCNRDRSRQNSRDSAARYRIRGKVAIADIRPARLWLAMNNCCAA
jgi:transposase